MAAEEGDYGDLGSGGLLTVKKGTTNGTKDTNGDWGRAECGMRIDEARRPRPAGSRWLFAFGYLHCVPVVSLRSADEARRPRPAGSLWLFAFGYLHCVPVVSLRSAADCGEWRVESRRGGRRAEGGGGTEGLGDGAHSSLKLSCPFFAKASNPFFAGGFEGFASRREVVGLSLYLPFFWDFVTGNRRKSLGKGVFFGGEGDSAQGERKGRLGKSYVDGACGGWGESLWSGSMIGSETGRRKPRRLIDMAWRLGEQPRNLCAFGADLGSMRALLHIGTDPHTA